MSDATAKRQEERVKLFATALSNLGVATVVTGLIAPVLAGRANALGTVTVFAYGGIALTALAMGAGTFLIIKFDQPKGPKKKTDA